MSCFGRQLPSVDTRKIQPLCNQNCGQSSNMFNQGYFITIFNPGHINLGKQGVGYSRAQWQN